MKGNSGENIYIGLVGMPKHQNEKNSSRESQVCHLSQAGRTAWFWKLGRRPVLGGTLWFPRWIFFILVFWHSYKAYVNVFTWISLQTFFYPMYPSNPQCFGLYTLQSIDFNKIYQLKDLKSKNKGHTIWRKKYIYLVLE